MAKVKIFLLVICLVFQYIILVLVEIESLFEQAQMCFSNVKLIFLLGIPSHLSTALWPMSFCCIWQKNNSTQLFYHLLSQLIISWILYIWASFMVVWVHSHVGTLVLNVIVMCFTQNSNSPHSRNICSKPAHKNTQHTQILSFYTQCCDLKLL